MIIAKHIPALQVLVPFFGALFSALCFNQKIARIITIITIFIGIFISIYGCQIVQQPISYFFGDWPAPIGIEYRIDKLNQPIILYIQGVLLFFLLFCHGFINSTILKSIAESRRHLFYAILLFAHTGYIGMLSTNDLFNLYVFIEIASLSSYILMAQSEYPKAIIGSFDYLILGTIGATLILIGVGFLFSKTGSLNITDIYNRLEGNYNSRIVITGAAFFILGAILKMAFFPMHFWMIRAYTNSSAIILVYLASISTMVGAYIFLRFANYVFDYNIIFATLSSILNPLSLMAILVCTFLAYRVDDLRSIIVYSSASQVGYAILLISITQDNSVLYQFLLADSINKIALFLIIAFAEDDPARNYSNSIISAAIALNLICSSGLPLGSLFIVKINILTILIEHGFWLSFIAIIIASAIALLYHYKIVKLLYFNFETQPLYFSKNTYGLIFITILQFLAIPIFYLV